MIRLSPEKGHSGALGGEICGDPMFADVSLVQHLSCLGGASWVQGPLQLCPREVGLGAVGLSQGKELSSLGGVSDCQPSKGHCRWVMGTRGSIKCTVPIHLPPRGLYPRQGALSPPQTQECSGGEAHRHCAHQEGLSLIILRAG